MLEVFRKPKPKKYTIDYQIKVMVVRIAKYLAEDRECSNKAIKLIKETKLVGAYKLFQANIWVYNTLLLVLDKHKGKMKLSAKEVEEDFLTFLDEVTIKGQDRLEGLKAFFEKLKEIVARQLDTIKADYEIARILQQDAHIIDVCDHNTDKKRAQEQLRNDNAFNKYKGLKGQAQLEYGCWYEPDTIRDLCDPISKTGIINYIFFDDINPNEAFKIKLTRVRSLIEKLARTNVVEADTRTICFISKEPGIGQNHFIFCMLSREKDGTYKLLIINPTGESKHKDFYTGLIEFEKQIDVTIYITRTVIQKDEGKEGIVSCGPICVELLNHISSLPAGQVNIILNGSNNESKINGEGENAITYNVIDVPEVLLQASLKGLIKGGAEEYKQSIIGIRKSHLKSLEQQSTEIASALVHGQKLLNKFVLGGEGADEKALVNKLLDAIKATQAPNNRLKGNGIKASSVNRGITESDELIAALMQQEELMSFNMDEKQYKSKQSYNNSSVMSTFHDQEKKKANNSKKENAFNAYQDLGYWYQELDIIRIGEIILKDKKDMVFVNALGRGHRIQSGNSVDAKAVLKNEQAKLDSGKRLVGLYNTGGNHWIAFIVFKDSKGKFGCRYKDSLGEERSDLKKDLEEAFGEIEVRCLSIGKAEQIEELDDAITIKGLVSCGIFALKNMNILASCSNIEEYEKLKYYTPAEHKKYEAELKGARREYALLYGQKVYEELSNLENPIKALLQELNIKEVDKELLSELAKRINVEERLLRGDIESQSREPKVDAQISKNKSLDEQSSIDKIKISKEPDKIRPSANDITPKSSSMLAFNKDQQGQPEKTGYEENKLKEKLKREYAKKDSLPKILEDEDFIEQKIDDTYVNLMLIEREEEQSQSRGNKSEEKEEKAYGSYEEIVAKKTGIDLGNIFDSKLQSGKSDSFEKRVCKCVEILQNLSSNPKYSHIDISKAIEASGVNIELYANNTVAAVSNAISTKYSDKAGVDSIELFLGDLTKNLGKSIAMTDEINPLETYNKQKPVKEVNKVLIYGRAGIGKTTLCNYISYKWAQPGGSEKQQGLWKEKFDYVFWLPLRDLSGDWGTQYKSSELRNYPLECFIAYCCLDRDSRFSIEDISKVVKEGNILLILDGYDEISSFHNEKRAEHTVIKNVINSAIEIVNKQAKVIMTSRPNVVSHGLIAKFDAEIENSGLKKENVYEYLKRYKFKEKEKAAGLTKFIIQHWHIESMVQVPINLYLLCWAYDKAPLTEQYITVTELYEKVTISLIKKYLETHKGVDLNKIRDNEAEGKCRVECEILEKLAYSGIQSKTAVLSKKLIEENGISGVQLEEIRKLGLLPAIGKGVKLVEEDHEFIHLTFQEYFAAKHIVKLLGSEDLKKAKEAVKFINASKYDRAYEKVILFVAGLVTQDAQKQSESSKKAMKYFWNVMLNGGIDLGAIRQIALIIRCLEEGKCSEGIPEIDKVLKVIKRYSLEHFGSLKQSLKISQQVLSRLGIINNFKDNLENSKDENVRRYAAYALGRLKPGDLGLAKAAVEVFRKDLKHSNVLMRSTAAKVLGELKLESMELTEALVKALCSALRDTDNSSWVRSDVASALGKLELEVTQLMKLVVETLCNALKDTDVFVRIAAASALEALKPGNGLVEALCQALKDTDQNVRIAALRALKKLKPRDEQLRKIVVEALCKTFEGPYEDVCVYAALSLVELELRDEQLTELLAKTLNKALESTNIRVRCNAAYVLGQLKPVGEEVTKLVVKALYKALNSPEIDVCLAAASALCQLKLADDEVAKIVTATLKHLEGPDEIVRGDAARVLGMLKPGNLVLEKAVVEALSKALKDPSQYVRITAAIALGRLNPGDVELAKTAMPALHEALDDPDRRIRLIATKALVELISGCTEVARKDVEVLSKALENSDEWVRIAAAEAFHALKVKDEGLQEEIAESLRNKASKTTNRFLPNSAINALRKFEVTSKKAQRQIAETLIENLLSTPHPAYRYEDDLNVALEKCAINGIKLCFTSHSIKLLEVSGLRIVHESAIVLDNRSRSMALYYGGLKLVFKFVKGDKELPLKVWEHFKQKAEKEKLPIEMLDSLRTGCKWIKIEGVEPEIELSNRITSHKEDIMIIKDNLELTIIPGADTLNKELILACTNESGPQSAIELYLTKNNSLYTGDKKYQSPILMAAMVLTYEKPEYIKQLDSVIKVLCKKSIGLSAVDGIGNTVAHYAVRYHRKDVLDACIDSGDYSKEVVNTYGINILHTAVYHNMIGELDNKLGEQNLDFDKQAESGKYTFTPIELAVATGSIEAIEKIWDMSRSITASSKWCRGNILNVAIEFKKDEVLHYLIYEKKYGISSILVQDAYVYASTAKGEGNININININAMRILEGSFVKMHKDCSIIKYSQMTGNTALHEVVSCEDMEHENKISVINYLLGQEVGLADVHNKHNQTAKELAKGKVKTLLTVKKGIEDTKKHEMPELGKVPIKNLILKGGGPNGIAYVGALREFEKKQKEEGWSEIERVAGTSAGAITAGLYAIGYSAEELEKDLAGIKLIELLDNPDVYKLMKLKGITSPWTVISSLFNEQGSGGHKLLFKIIKALGEYNGLCAGKKFEEIIEGLIEKKTGKKNFTLGDLGEKVRKGEKGYKELYVVTLNILNVEDPLVILSTEEENYREIRLADAIRASMSIPIVFEPKEIKYRDKKSGEYIELKCIDGGLMYNYPIDIFDKVKFRYTGIRGEGQKPIYNEYTMGLSLYSKEIEEKQEIETSKEKKEKEKEKEKEKMTIGQIAMKDAVSIAEGVLKWATTEDLGEIRKGVGKIKKVALQIMNILYKAEEVMSKYWEDSRKVRTVEIDSCGVTLLDFDLSEDVVNKLMREGAITVNKKFGMDIGQGAPATIDMQRLTGAVHEVTQKSSREANANIIINTNNTYTSTSSLNRHNMHNISEDRVPQVRDLDDEIHINIKDKQVRRSGDCRLF